jgi:hypothetical protein
LTWGFAPKPCSGVFTDARCAARSPAHDLVKGRENSGAEKGVKGLPQFVHRLWRGPFPDKDRACPYHRPAGWELRKGPVRVDGDRRMPAVSRFPQGQLVSSMEGTSGAADPAPLRGGAGDAALGSGCVVPACPCASVVRSRVARHWARPLGHACSGPAGLRPSRGWSLRGGIVKASLSRGLDAWGHTHDTGPRRFGGFPPVTSGSVGVSSRHCSGLMTRGVRVDRVGVAASPGRPQG